MHDLSRRYARQLALPEVGEAGQRRLSEAHVLIVGMGGLGSVIAPYLAAAGVGRLSLVDFDEVSLSNLQRQPLYGERDLGRLKVEVACERLAELNSALTLSAFPCSLEELCCAEGSRGQLSPPQALSTLDLIVDATDRLSTRDLICALSHQLAVPHVYGSVNGFEGQVALFRPHESCYRCLFPRLPRPGLIQSCAQAGVIGPAPAMIGSAQALLCLRELTQSSSEMAEPLTTFDLKRLSTYQLPLGRSADCLYHGTRAVRSARPRPLSASSLVKRWRGGWRPLIIDVREPSELEAGLIKGARSCPLSALEGWAFGAHELQELGLGELSAEAPLELVIYCARGPRAERAAQLLLEHGDTRAADRLTCWELVGGWLEWVAGDHSLT